MSCVNGADCKEAAKRHVALAVLGLMLIIFLILSLWSFLPSRKQALPAAISFDGVGAIDGKRVFQAYNCMDCHTVVGNGAYFGPDLTDIYRQAGPAWLAAFLPSAGGWPTQAAVQVQLQNPAIQQDAGTGDIEAYRKRYPGAAERMDQRGGLRTDMPNLPFSAVEVKGLIAFLKYTSAMDTEGWPPKPHADRKIPVRYLPASRRADAGTVASGATAPAAQSVAPSADSQDLAAVGEKIATNLGCMSCHATDTKRVVGPGWGGLYGSTVSLADGTTVKADDAYLEESIREPDAKIVKGYPPHVMPSYDKLVNDADMKAIVAYLRSLGAGK